MQPVFFALLSRMQNVQRWGKSNPTRTENVAEHSMQVALFAHALGLIRNRIFTEQPPVDADRLAVLALFHDAPEVLTEDVNSGIKYADPRMLSLCRKMESIATELLVKTAPEPLQPDYQQLLQPHEEDLLGAFVKAADLLSAYTKALAELRTGNLEFTQTEQKVLQALQPYCQRMPEVAWFMENLTGSFHLTIDDLVDIAFAGKTTNEIKKSEL